jgi:tRNA nucleotidyltransferase/poly(A) polymerase
MRCLVEEKLAKKIPQEVIEIFTAFRQGGWEIFLVGGAVRDLLLKGSFIEADFTTNATPEEIQKIFPKSFYDNVFGTVGLIIKTKKGEVKYEITTYRSEKGYSDKRRPDQVFWGNSLEEDLKRRDFTINAMAIGPKDNDLELIDLFNGLDDLKNKTIKAVGNPNERFSEDALRMLRAVRFASQLGFTIEENTFAAISKNASLLKYISAERIRDELLKILATDFPTEGITLLKTSSLLSHIIPELEKGYEMAQAKHHIYDGHTHFFL